MKKFILFYLLVIFFNHLLLAQDKPVKSHSIGFQFSFIDFPTAQDLRSNSIGDVLKGDNWYAIGRMEPSLTLNYVIGINSNIDFMSRLTTSFMRYPYRDSSDIATNDKFYAEADANVNLKLLTDNYVVVPYLQAGLGASTTQKNFMAHIPLGVGLQIRLGKNSYINLNSNYRIPVTAKANRSLMHSFGVLSTIINPKPKPKPLPPPPVAPPVVDGDNDGVADSVDLCPTVAGLPELKGCPDSDKDGISDNEDKCPNEAGLAKYNGCPIPDTDKDGVNDEMDKCPDVPGVERYEGCPVPDSDKDGINDEEDKCPAIAGSADEAGCPPVDYKAKNIQFKLGSSVLNAKSKNELNALAKFLNENVDVKIYLDGHADSTGTEERNTNLSLERAQSVGAYLTSKGVNADRISTKGFSSSSPIASNASEKGRILNRRVEIKLKRY